MVAVESETGKGTRVVVQLPLSGAAERPPARLNKRAHAA
jgi:hypothetical protein